MSLQLLLYEDCAIYSTYICHIRTASNRTRRQQCFSGCMRIWATKSYVTSCYVIGGSADPQSLQDLTEDRLTFDGSMRTSMKGATCMVG